ncbi:MAG: 1-acyl-sn-glycerol-3-phosphate acyltransferase [Anaerolineaceae bacterium]|nr:1-acyl-sn-glycerol-3-phosphate acyltransferase [Anaerolineaceae bacterium]
MSLSQRLLVALFRGVTGSIFRIHDEALARIPQHGPLILLMNHVNILEIPLIYARLQPRRVRGLVLADRWQNPLIGWGLDTCGAIPLERGGINFSSINRALDVLKAGEILLIMPEGTRSGNGILQKGHPGVVLLALKSKAPLLPIISYGGEKYKENIQKLRRTDFFLRVGEQFTPGASEKEVDSRTRAKILDQIMHRMAELLPPEYRGVYSAPNPNNHEET